MTDHAAIVATSAGPVGVIVSVPDEVTRGALIFFQGGGAPCRAGVNGRWAQLARDLAKRGIAVLRFDFALEGDSTMVGEDMPRDVGWRSNTDLAIVRELAPWFCDRVGLEELLVAGSCHGARVAMDFAADEPCVRGTFLIVPYLWNVPPQMRPDKQMIRQKSSLPRASELFDQGSSDVQAQRDADLEVEAITDSEPLEDNVVESFRRVLEDRSAWIMIGEGDSQKPLELKQRLGQVGERLDVEVIPGMILHPVTHPEVQDLVVDRLTNRLLSHVGAL